MNYQKLEKLNKLYFTCQDVANNFGINPRSANVLCNRYVKNGSFVRLKRNFYILNEKWKTLTEKDLYFLANILQVPSYISLSTALSYYQITTQLQQNFVESIAINRTLKLDIDSQVFSYTKIKRKLYFGFVKLDNFFIATKEKAFLDAIYLVSFNKYELDFSAIDFAKLDKKIIKKLVKKYPLRTAVYLEKLWKS
jgi:predicted transcriptional regulator of viral defense system